jgi:hypothetical protein
MAMVSIMAMIYVPAFLVNLYIGGASRAPAAPPPPHSSGCGVRGYHRTNPRRFNCTGLSRLYSPELFRKELRDDVAVPSYGPATVTMRYTRTNLDSKRAAVAKLASVRDSLLTERFNRSRT